jgi:peptidyl-prolyl cis-trans isomerase B (cyclophilin B)
VLRTVVLFAMAVFAMSCGVDRDDTAGGAAGGDAADIAAEQASEVEFAERARRYSWPDGPHPTATILIAGHDSIVIELYPELAKETVDNFAKLAESGFYEGTTFHRVIPDFMIQGGDPNSKDDNPDNDGQGGPEHKINDEFHDAPHVRGVLSMANTGHRNSGGSQFFILQADAPHLDGKHAIFGRVRAGMDVVDGITLVETDRYGRWGAMNRPVEDVVIEKVTVEKVVIEKVIDENVTAETATSEEAEAAGEVAAN